MTNSTIKLLRENIKKYRKEKGYTQLKMGILTGLSKDHITAIELGRRIPSIEKLTLIAHALGVEVKDLFS